MRPRRFQRRPPSPDPYAEVPVSRTRVWRRGGDDRIAIWLLLFALGVAVAVFLVVVVLTRGDDDGQNPAARTVTLPNLLNADHVTAAERLERLQLVVDTYPVPGSRPAGTVVAQTPGPDSELGPGSIVRLDVSRGPIATKPLGPVPDVTGSDANDARRVLRKAGFTVLTVLRDAPSRDQVGKVLVQDPAAGTQVDFLEQIDLYVGR